MQRLEITDFSGGISEQYAQEGFSERQWSKLKGVIIDTDFTVRSQWPAQSVGYEDGRLEGNIDGEVVAVSGFRGNLNTYLVAVDDNGVLWWAIAPSRDADYEASRGITWYPKLADRTGADIPPDTYQRFLCEVLLPIENVGEANALLVNSTAGANSLVFYENDSYSEANPINGATNGLVLVKQWDDTRYPVDQPNLIDPLVGETKDTTTAMSFTATTTWQTVESGSTVFTGGTTTTQPGTRWTVANDGEYPIQLRVVRIGTGTETSPQFIDLSVGSGENEIPGLSPKDSYTAKDALKFLGSPSTLQVLQVRLAPTILSGSSKIRVGIALGTYPLARRNVMPRANVGTMWRNRLVLGDIRKRKDPTQPWEGNQKRAKYGVFYSEVEPDSFREQAILYAGSGESQVVGMHVLDDYLITVSSAETETDGLRLFKGTLDYLRLQENEVTLNINVLRGGVGPSQETGIATQNLSPSCVWPEAGVVVFLDSLGGVWYTDGVEIDRLDRTGPIMPDVTTPNDEVAAIGKYLFVWRAGRMLVLNILSGVRGESGTAAWTELSMPEDVTVRSMCPLDGSMYFVMDGKVWRFALSRNLSYDDERACFDYVDYPITIATPTIGDQDKHTKINWFNYGMRARARGDWAWLYSTRMIAGPALDPSAPEYPKLFGNEEELSGGRQINDRDEIVLKCGIGFRTEGSAEFVLYGDVQIESVSFWTSGVRMSRPEL